MQGNSFYITMMKGGSKKEKAALMLQWACTMEVCELIGILMLSLLSKYISKNHIRLYRDGCLAILKNTSTQEQKNPRTSFKNYLKENI